MVDIQALLARHENIAGAVSESMVLIDRSARCVSVDAAFCAAMQVDASAVLGFPIRDFFLLERDQAVIAAATERALRGERVTHTVSRARGEDQRIEYNVAYIPLVGQGQQVDLVLLVFRSLVDNGEASTLMLRYGQYHQLLEALDSAIVGERPLEAVAALVINYLVEMPVCAGVCILLTNQDLITAASSQLLPDHPALLRTPAH